VDSGDILTGLFGD